MPMIPAYCQDCGQPRLSDVKIKDATYHIQDQPAGRCRCGGELRLLDGTYSHLGGPLNFCRAPREEVERFAQACQACGVEYHVDLG